MISVDDLLGPLKALRSIQPPKGSYADWDRFLEECRKAGIAALDKPGGVFATPLGYALLRRWRWLKESRERGIPYQEATVAFDAMVERDRDASLAGDRDRMQTAARAMRERDGGKRGRRAAPESEDLLEYADERFAP